MLRRYPCSVNIAGGFDAQAGSDLCRGERYPSADDFSRYIIAWKLCRTMKAKDVTHTLSLALHASGLDAATVVHRPRLLSDNAQATSPGNLAEWLKEQL